MIHLAILVLTLSAIEPTKTAQTCPKGSAIAQRTVVADDGTIRIITRCVKVSR